MSNRKDSAGRPLMVGDKVVFSKQNSAYLQFGRVISFTEKKIRVGLDDGNYAAKFSNQVCLIQGAA